MAALTIGREQLFATLLRRIFGSAWSDDRLPVAAIIRADEELADMGRGKQLFTISGHYQDRLSAERVDKRRP